MIFSLMDFVGDPIYQYLSKGFRGQPSFMAPLQLCHRIEDCVRDVIRRGSQ